MDNNNVTVIQAPTPELAPGGAGELERTTARLFQVLSQDLGRAYDLCDRFLGLFERAADHVLPAVAARLDAERQCEILRAQSELERAQASAVQANAQAELTRAQALKTQAEAEDIRFDIEYRRQEAGRDAQERHAPAF
jgi:hypothetical protein